MTNFAWFVFGIIPFLIGFLTTFAFQQIIVSFNLFLSASEKTTLGAVSVIAGTNATNAGKGKDDAGSVLFKNKIAPTKSSHTTPATDEDAQVIRMKKQRAAVRGLKRNVPYVCVILVIIGFIPLSDDLVYSFKFVLPIMFCVWGVFLFTSTYVMYKGGARKRANDAKRSASRRSSSASSKQTDAASSVMSSAVTTE